jgi:predicted regulator of Ras-like GTPase activity (Roadblock/LC7/MglB family)
VSTEDGLVIADSSMVDVDPAAAAALAGSLAVRLAGTLAAAGRDTLRSLHLEGTEGSVMAAPVAGELLLVLLTTADANVGLLRLALRDAALRLA